MNPAVLLDTIVLWVVSKVWTYKKTSAAMAGVIGLAFLQSTTPVAIPYWLTHGEDQFSVIRYGANPDPRQTLTVNTENSGSNVIEVTSGTASRFKVGQDVVIEGAGAAHQWAAVTPSIGGVGRGGSTRYTVDTSTDEITTLDFTGAATAQPVVFYTTGGLQTVGGVAQTAGTTYYLRLGSTLKSYKVYPTANDATNNTNAYNFDGSGTGTHSLAFTGSTTIAYYLAGDSGNLGLTVASSAPSFTTSSALLNAFSYNVVWWDKVVDGSSNEVNGYHLWTSRDGSTEHYLTRLNRAMNAMKVVCQSGGYTNFVPTDVGKTVLAGGNFRGKLEWYDNPTRTLIISQDRAGDYTYPASATIALYHTATDGSPVASGVGAGTVTGTSTHCYYYRDYGDVAWGDYKAAVFHTGVEQQKLQISGTPSAGSYYVCLYGQEQAVAYNADSATLQTAIRKLPRCSGVTVTTDSGSAPNITHLIKFYGGASGDEGLGDVPEIQVRSYMTGGVPVMTVATTVPGCRTNPGDLAVYPATSSGVFYECEQSPGFHAAGESAPSFDSTLNNITAGSGHGLIWRRRNQAFPITKPAAATANALYARITAINPSTDALTINTTTGTTITSGKSVWPNSLPGFQRTWDAIIANKGGMVEVPPGHYSLFSGTHDKTEWIGQISSGDYCFFETMEASGSHRLPLATGFTGREATICWRPSEVECYRDAYEGTDFIKSQSIVNFVSNDAFTWDVKTFYVAASGEPKGNSINVEHSCRMFSAVQGGGDYETGARVFVTDADILGLPNGLGSFETSSFAPTIRHEVRGGSVQYGGGGHDAGSNCGTFTDWTIEGTNSQYRSTVVYTGLEQDYGLEWNNVRCLEPGNDGLRLRGGYVHIKGGQIFITDRVANCRPFLIEDTCKGFDIEGLEITGEATLSNLCNATIAAPGKIRDCVTRNASFTLTGSHVEAENNKGYITNAALNGSSESWWLLSNATDITLIGNILNQTNLTTGGSERSNTNGLTLTGASTTRIKSVGNKMRAGRNGLRLDSSFVGTFDDFGSDFYGYDNGGDGSVNIFNAGSGAKVKLVGTNLGTLNSVAAWPILFTGATNAQYHLFGCTLDGKVSVAANLTGTDNRFEKCKFPNSNASEFLDSGTKIFECEFAVEPTLTGTLLATRDNTVAGSLTKSVTLTASQNDYAWPTICDTILVDANGSYSITGIQPRAKGCIVNIVNVDSSDNLTLSHNSGSSSAGNKININNGSDFVEGPSDSKQLLFTGGASLGATEN